MLVTSSPLVGRMSGKTAGLVMASWKGRQYARMWVIPANPDTDAQKVVRQALARCVTLWRSLHTAVKTFLDLYAAGYRMSGYNVYVSKNRVREEDETDLKPVPDNPKVPAVKDFAAVEGVSAAGDIDCTWTKLDPVDLPYVGIFARQTETDKFTEFAAPPDGAETFTITGLEPGVNHDVYAFYHASDPLDCGTSVCIADVTAKAA